MLNIIIKIILLVGLIIFVENCILDFNSYLIEYKKNHKLINILVINIFIITLAGIISFIKPNKYDLDNNGKTDFDDVLVLKAYLIEK